MMKTTNDLILKSKHRKTYYHSKYAPNKPAPPSPPQVESETAIPYETLYRSTILTTGRTEEIHNRVETLLSAHCHTHSGLFCDPEFGPNQHDPLGT